MAGITSEQIPLMAVHQEPEMQGDSPALPLQVALLLLLLHETGRTCHWP